MFDFVGMGRSADRTIVVCRPQGRFATFAHVLKNLFRRIKVNFLSFPEHSSNKRSDDLILGSTSAETTCELRLVLKDSIDEQVESPRRLDVATKLAMPVRMRNHAESVLAPLGHVFEQLLRQHSRKPENLPANEFEIADCSSYYLQSQLIRW